MAGDVVNRVNLLRETLVSSPYEALIWAAAYVLLVTVWSWVCHSRLQGLLNRIRTEDSALWRELGCPESWREIGTWSGRTTFRRLRIDEAYARHFNPLVVARIREVQREITASLVILAFAGCVVIYVVWPFRN